MSPFSLKRLLLMLAAAVALLYVSACILLYASQRSLIYHPTAATESVGASVITIESEGERLSVLNRPVESPNAVILFGGNADDVSNYLGSFAAVLPEENLFLVNYRGYGGSSGEPSEAALFADALAIYDQVHARFSRITVVGRSLGTGVAVYLASERKVDNLILITPYDSITNVAKSHFPIFPIDLLLEDRFESASRVRNVSARTLVLVAESDRTIPRENTDALIGLFPKDQIVVKTLAGTNHASITSGGEYTQLMRDFLHSTTNPQ